MNTTRKACGTPAGYSRHLKAGEAACRPCKDAEAARTRTRRYSKHPIKRLEPRPSATETAAEIDFMFSIGQGWGPTMHALGYTNPGSLARQLHRAGRRDLAVIFEDQNKAA